MPRCCEGLSGHFPRGRTLRPSRDSQLKKAASEARQSACQTAGGSEAGLAFSREGEPLMPMMSSASCCSSSRVVLVRFLSQHCDRCPIATTTSVHPRRGRLNSAWTWPISQRIQLRTRMPRTRETKMDKRTTDQMFPRMAGGCVLTKSNDDRLEEERQPLSMFLYQICLYLLTLYCQF